MKRTFERTGIHCDEGLTRAGYAVVCHDCGATDSVIASGHTKSLPADVTRMKFSRKGWTITDNPSRDLCPECNRKKMMKAPSPNVVTIKSAADAQKEVQARITADPPREMQREDKRLVFGKIDAVYLDENRGYENGWSDKRVAEDLGVPLAWVRSVREADFGPEGLSHDGRKALEEAIKFKAEVNDLQTKLAGLNSELADLKSRFARTERNIEDISKLTVR